MVACSVIESVLRFARGWRNVSTERAKTFDLSRRWRCASEENVPLIWGPNQVVRHPPVAAH